MKELIRKILREQEREKMQTVSLPVSDPWPEFRKQNAKRFKDMIDAADWELFLHGLEIPEEDSEEPQVIKDLNALVLAIEDGKKDNQLIRTKEFKRLNLDKDKIAFWRNHLNKPEVKSVWARTKSKIKNWLDGLEKDSAVAVNENQWKRHIKKILREQEDPMDTHAEKVQDLDSADEPGGWKNPLIDDSPGNVPPTSYEGQKYNHKTRRYYKPTVSKNIFFKATQILTKMKDATWFTQHEDDNDSLWHRQQDMSTALKVLGIDGDGSGLADKIYWAANDNRIGILDGSITNYDQLWLRPLVKYKVPLFEAVREYKTIYWAPLVECYSKEDAFNTVLYDEDGVYDSWEWDGDPSYQQESDEWEGEGKELDSEVEVVKTLYPGEKGGEPIKESIIEEMGPSPEENDIISELTELVQSWNGCEEGRPVACRYQNQVQEIIDRYKSKPLT